MTRLTLRGGPHVPSTSWSSHPISSAEAILNSLKQGIAIRKIDSPFVRRATRRRNDRRLPDLKGEGDGHAQGAYGQHCDSQDSHRLSSTVVRRTARLT